MSLYSYNAIVCVFICLLLSCGCQAAELELRQIMGQADVGTIEIHGVSAGDFTPENWEQKKLNLLPDTRAPLIAPRKRGMFRNIYAPSVVELDSGWRVFYGGWDGIENGNDMIYSVDTLDFIDFTDRSTIINNGDFIHCCNVNAIRFENGDYRLMCTVYPDKNDRNKPATFTSPDGNNWNSEPKPYPAKMTDIINIKGYENYTDADINGMNVILYEDSKWRLFFNNFRNFGKTYRATSEDGKNFEYDGSVLDFAACVNDVKKFTANGSPWYLMGLHFNGDTMWYSLSKDGVKFDNPNVLTKNTGQQDRYMVALGWVVSKNKLLGFLYGAGELSSLDRNRIFAQWLQKKVVFVSDDGEKYAGKNALGPDRQIIEIPRDKTLTGRFEIYAEDGTTPMSTSEKVTVVSGAVFVVSSRESEN